MKLAIFSIVACAICIGCADPPVTPTPPPECQTKNTAMMRFGNTSNRVDQDVILDGILIISGLARGQISEPRVVAAGVAHTLLFRNTGVVTVACGPSTPILVQCTDQTFTCDKP